MEHQPVFDPNLPVVALFNNTESFYPYLRRAEDRAPWQEMRRKGERALLWLGDAKLVFLSPPAPVLAYLQERVAYPNTRCLVPEDPSPWLSLDVLRRPALLEAIAAHAGAGRAVQLIPYATTPQFLELAATLERDHGLRVLLPESPHPDA